MIAATAVAASLCIGVVAFAWQAKVARDQRDLAVKAQKVARDQRDLAVKAEKAEAEQRGIAEAARKETELALTESQGKTARMTYERAQALCEGGQADVGLLWMARSLELTPPGAKDLDFAIRTSINLWGQQFNTVRHSWYDTRAEAYDIAVSPDGLSLLVVGHKGIARVGKFDRRAPV